MTTWRKVTTTAGETAWQCEAHGCIAHVLGGAWAVVDAGGDETCGDETTDGAAMAAADREIDSIGCTCIDGGRPYGPDPLCPAHGDE